MIPSRDQIEVAAYHRWRRQGHAHGFDRQDWLAAERDLTFALNYRFLARYRLDGDRPQILGGEGPRTCRFCERAEPDAGFSRAWPTIPERFGNTSLASRDECDECRSIFIQTLEGELERFAGPFLGAPLEGRRVISAAYTWVGRVPGEREGDRDPEPITIQELDGGLSSVAIRSEPYVPIAAFKALVRMGLALLPEQELHHVEDALEWVSNPDHGLDARLFETIGCHAYLTPVDAPESWAAVARRVDDETSFPSLLFFLGAGRVIFQVHLPLDTRDEDLDDDSMQVPTVSMSGGEGSDFHESERVFVPLTSAEPRTDARLELEIYEHRA